MPTETIPYSKESAMKEKTITTKIETLGEAKVLSPLAAKAQGGYTERFVKDEDRVLIDVNLNKIKDTIKNNVEPPSFEKAGPREKIYFDPSKLKCAIVTCGGLCPGLNDIIRSVVLELYHCYGVKNIYGIRHGLQGFIPEFGHEVMELTAASVSNILDMGGTILGSSRGTQDIGTIVDCLERMNIGILFMVGGDGTLVAAKKIAETITERNLKVSIIVIPKTIDNDIYLVSRTFGFDTAVDIATIAIKGAHNEARGYPNGIGLIKLMGRHSGFLAATAALAQQDANFVLIPEIEIQLTGENGFLAALERRMKERKHAVIVVAEGAGQRFFENQTTEYDPSGNIKLKDIGTFLKNEISQWFKERNNPVTLKYIDPSYIIRSLPANSNDCVYCGFLGRDAVHAGMAGKTKLLVSNWNNHYVHIPMEASAGQRKYVDPKGKLWQSVLEATGQGALINGKAHETHPA
ncbi:ABC-type branched-chain amino acid transporter, periplasmic substrate-binding protein [Desulforapulum autotrophicum HRM2]|uniref:ATP-dependent 6-phosphofructokinase n=2 Tax=Desulforapulum autotrophicum TaxID=2296 RepID=C0QEG9_DESAH|nr:ABC-type branched-chain amino acid transporter, periplasmic substrate-binding protein [Desulforapulum autotrophicum HRM2]